MDNFDLKKYLTENKLTPNSQKLNENEKPAKNVSPEQAADVALKTATKIDHSQALEKLAQKIAQDPTMQKQLANALKSGGLSLNEDLESLGMDDAKTLALNFAKKAASGKMSEVYIKDWEPETSDAGDNLTVPATMGAFVGGGVLGTAFSSAIIAAIPALATGFAAPAVVAGIAGVALVLLAKKVYKMTRQSKYDKVRAQGGRVERDSSGRPYASYNGMPGETLEELFGMGKKEPKKVVDK
jgi:hypothetical protein